MISVKLHRILRSNPQNSLLLTFKRELFNQTLPNCPIHENSRKQIKQQDPSIISRKSVTFQIIYPHLGNPARDVLGILKRGRVTDGKWSRDILKFCLCCRRRRKLNFISGTWQAAAAPSRAAVRRKVSGWREATQAYSSESTNACNDFCQNQHQIIINLYLIWYLQTFTHTQYSWLPSLVLLLLYRTRREIRARRLCCKTPQIWFW